MILKRIIQAIFLPTLFFVSADAAYAQYRAPINYAAVQEALDRASKPTIAQRILGYLSTPMVERNNLQLQAHAGVAYTRETNIGVALSTSALYRTHDNYPQSSASLSAMASITGFYRVEAQGEHFIGMGANRLLYDVGVASMPTHFWGLGYEAARNNARTQYTRFATNLTLTFMQRIVGSFDAGVGIDLRYGQGSKFDAQGEEYLVQGGQTIRSAFSTGLHMVAELDLRDNPHTTTRGVYLWLKGEMRPKGLGGIPSTLWHITAQADFFQPLWQGATAAIDLYADMWSSATPWFYWSALGGQSRMRGYYYGRYTASKMATAQLELRQNIYGPFGAVAWVGAGSIFSSFKTFDWNRILPSYGVGLRMSVNKRTALRLDYGWGQHTSGLIINVNEAF